MIQKLLKIYKQQEDKILYVFFGGCTTFVNIACYYLLYQKLGISNFWSNIAAWIVGVAFAFVTNKKYVFKSRTETMKALMYEMVSFVGCRLATGVMDLVIMLFTVDFMKWNALIWKVISNVLVIILNYVASKFFIFKHKEQQQ